MALNRAYDQYMQNSIYTANPEELTLMLYNGLVKFIMQAKMALEEKKLDRASNSIIRAQDIIMELRNSLNMEIDISANLDLLYDYMYRRMVDANINKEPEILDEVLEMAKELRDTWAEAMKIYRKQGTKDAAVSSKA